MELLTAHAVNVLQTVKCIIIIIIIIIKEHMQVLVIPGEGKHTGIYFCELLADGVFSDCRSLQHVFSEASHTEKDTVE